MQLVNETLKRNSTEGLTPSDVDAMVAKAEAEYRRLYPEAVENQAGAVDDAVKAMGRILRRSTFEAAGVTWRSFPNNTGHKDFPGCFRCHNGKHLNEEGQSIRLHCNICHDIPIVHREGGPAPVPSTKIPGLKQPPSHLAANFMHEHRFKINSSCAACHGEVKFGRDGGSFCSNPACHGRKWPEVNLNVSLKGSQD